MTDDVTEFLCLYVMEVLVFPKEDVTRSKGALLGKYLSHPLRLFLSVSLPIIS